MNNEDSVRLQNQIAIAFLLLPESRSFGLRRMKIKILMIDSMCKLDVAIIDATYMNFSTYSIDFFIAALSPQLYNP